MDVILIAILTGLAVLAVPIVLIVVVVDLRALRRRVAALEADLARLGRAPDGAGRRPEERADAPAPEGVAETTAEAPAEPFSEAPAGGDTEAAGSAADRLPEVAEEAPAAAPPASGPSAPIRVFGWLREYWFHAISAISLGLAGIFLVQYGVETGLLSPPVRVLLALALGAALLAAGELIRRRWGDAGAAATAYLPSTFSGAGIVVLYAAILAARGLYGLIGAEAAFAGLVFVCAVAIVFGWYYGAFLAAAGLSGAAAAPFLVGGDPGSAMPFYLYYGLLGATGLAIDAMRRWGWVSVLALVLAFLLGALVRIQGGEISGFLALVAWLALVAMALPRLELWPSHPGPAVFEALAAGGRQHPIPPTWIAAGAMAASSLILLFAATGKGEAAGMLAAILLALLALAPTLWAHRAPGLADLALLPAAAFLAFLVVEAFAFGSLYRTIALYDPAAHPEESPPLTVSLILSLATAVSLGAAWRSLRGHWRAFWAAGAAVFAPAAAVVFELFWQPAAAIGGYFWAGHALALAALMTLLAERFARAEPADRRPAAYATLSALSLIALALFILLSKAALTVALSVLVVVAVALDRRFRLPEMWLFVLAGVLTLGWRLVVDPGLPGYLEMAPLAEVALAFGSALGGLAAARALLPPEGREDTAALLESALWAFGGTLATVLLWRFIVYMSPTPAYGAWAASLLGMTWTTLALAQLYRLTWASRLPWLGALLAVVFGLFAAIAFFVALTVLNPFLGLNDDIYGRQPLDTLSVAYLLPGLLFAGIATFATWLRPRAPFAWLSGLFIAMWVFLEIRWYWHGNLIGVPGFTQPELYSYTVALLLAGGGLLYQAVARHSTTLRRFALAVIGVAIAKVFLVDAAGLTGLLRVFSFLVLGLVLAGLAWFDRWASGRGGEAGEP